MKKVFIGNTLETNSLRIKIQHKKFYYYNFHQFEDEILQTKECQVVGNTYLKKYKESEPLKLICFGKSYTVYEKRKNKSDTIKGYIEVNEGKYIRVLKRKRHWMKHIFATLTLLIIFLLFYFSSQKMAQLFENPYPSRMEMEQQLQ